MPRIRLPVQTDIKTRDGSTSKDSLVSNAFNDGKYTVKRSAILSEFSGGNGSAQGAFAYGAYVYHWDAGSSPPSSPTNPIITPLSSYVSYVVYDSASPTDADYRWVKVSPFGNPNVGQFFTNSGYPLTPGSSIKYTSTIGTSPPITSFFLDRTVFQYKLYLQTEADLSGSSSLSVLFDTDTPKFVGFSDNDSGVKVAAYWDIHYQLHALNNGVGGTAISAKDKIVVGNIGNPCYWDLSHGTITNLPTAGSGIGTCVGICGVNKVGSYSKGTPAQYVCYWDPANILHDLVPLNPGTRSVVYAGAGDIIVGVGYLTGDIIPNPCYWSVQSNTITVAPISVVNTDGTTMVGTTILPIGPNPKGTTYAASCTVGGGASPLMATLGGAIPGGSGADIATEALGVNGSYILGRAVLPDNTTKHACYWDSGGAIHDLGVLPGDTISYAYGMSKGIIYGISALTYGGSKACYWDASFNIHLLPTLSVIDAQSAAIGGTL